VFRIRDDLLKWVFGVTSKLQFIKKLLVINIYIYIYETNIFYSLFTLYGKLMNNGEWWIWSYFCGYLNHKKIDELVDYSYVDLLKTN